MESARVSDLSTLSLEELVYSASSCSMRAVKRSWNESQLYALLNHLQLCNSQPPSGPSSQRASLREEGISMSLSLLLLYREGCSHSSCYPFGWLIMTPFTFSLAHSCIYSASEVVSFPLRILLMPLQSVKCGRSVGVIEALWRFEMRS